MSKFIEKLNKLTRGEMAPIGFRRALSSSGKKKIQLVEYREKAGITAGADAVLLATDGKEIDAAALKGMTEDCPWGAWLKDGGAGALKTLAEAGCDFIVFPPDAPLTLLEEKKIGKVIEIDAALPDGMLRSVVELSVEAVLISVAGGEAKSLSFRDIMTVQRFGGIPNKPLFAVIPENVTAGGLEALWEAGVTAVIAKAGIEKLRETIDAAEFKSARKRDKIEPVVPRQSAGAVPDDEDDEDEDY